MGRLYESAHTEKCTAEGRRRDGPRRSPVAAPTESVGAMPKGSKQHVGWVLLVKRERRGDGVCTSPAGREGDADEEGRGVGGEGSRRATGRLSDGDAASCLPAKEEERAVVVMGACLAGLRARRRRGGVVPWVDGWQGQGGRWCSLDGDDAMGWARKGGGDGGAGGGVGRQPRGVTSSGICDSSSVRGCVAT